MAKGKKKKKKDPLQAKKDMISIIIIGAGIVIGLFLGMVLVTVSQQKSGVKQVAVYVEGGQSFKLSTKLTVLEDVLKENDFAVFSEDGKIEEIGGSKAEDGGYFTITLGDEDVTDNLKGTVVKDGDAVFAAQKTE